MKRNAHTGRPVPRAPRCAVVDHTPPGRRPTLSVAVITWNHERFLAQALDGALMQQTGFPVEIVAGDDGSTDRSPEILRDYQRRHPDRIRLALWDGNRGVIPNWVSTLRACRGAYVALLESDDYWTAPDKLQRQVDFLDAHPDYAMCFHNAMVVHEDGSRPPHPAIADRRGDLTIEDLIRGNHFNRKNFMVGAAPTASAVFRNGLVTDLPPWYFRLLSPDIPLYVLLARHGKARFENVCHSVYRRHPGGVTSWPSHRGRTLYPNRIYMYRALDRHLGYRYHRIIQPLLARFHLELARCLAGRWPDLPARAAHLLRAAALDRTLLPEIVDQAFAHRPRTRRWARRAVGAEARAEEQTGS